MYTVGESTDLVYMLVKDVWYTYSLGLMFTADVSFTFMIYVLRINFTATTSPARASLSKTMPRTLTLSESNTRDVCLLLLLICSLWGTFVCCRVNRVRRFTRAVEKASVLLRWLCCWWLDNFVCLCRERCNLGMILVSLVVVVAVLLPFTSFFSFSLVITG